VSPEGRIRFRITMSDVDVVQFFFADYFRWMERAMAELLVACGYARTQAMADRVAYPVVEACCSYAARARLDEQLDVVARFVEMRERSFRVGYGFASMDGAAVATGFTHHVCVGTADMRPRRVPAPLACCTPGVR
jgi:YbgC/YbaW family acyl-CoA thioester hydrolase